MTRIIIKYKLELNVQGSEETSFESLATEVHDGFLEVPIPANPIEDIENEVPVYLTRSFQGYDQIRTWKVLRIENSNSDDGSTRCEIFLQRINKKLLAPSLNDIHNNGIKINQGQINKSLRFGTLIECDFGYFSDSIDVNNKVERLVDYYNYKLPFEMVKRRLCVVVSNYIDPCLVIPISSKNDDYNKSSVVTLENFPNNLYKYNDNIEHYVKGTMLTSVSSHRIFPLLVQPRGRRPSLDTGFKSYIKNQNDIDKIKGAILNTTDTAKVIEELAEENKELTKHTEELEQSCSIQEKKLRALEVEVLALKEENTAFQELYAEE